MQYGMAVELNARVVVYRHLFMISNSGVIGAGGGGNNTRQTNTREYNKVGTAAVDWHSTI